MGLHNTKPILLEDLGILKIGNRRQRYGKYECVHCGNTFTTAQKKVDKRIVGSCGCQIKKNKEVNITELPLYPIWYGMKARCYNPKTTKYKDYGGRGIKVCDRWLDINNFIEDMYPPYKEGLTLDRIDVNGDYEPDNCRWTTKEVQQRNTRDIQSNNTSGYRGVSYFTDVGKWASQIMVDTNKIFLGMYDTALEASKAYEIYVRIHSLEHNFTNSLTLEELELLYSFQQYLISKNKNITKMYKSFVSLILT